MAGSAVRTWFNSSPLIGSTLQDCKWYNDKEWNHARSVSQQIRDKNAFSGKRHYSTTTRSEEVCKL